MLLTVFQFSSILLRFFVTWCNGIKFFFLITDKCFFNRPISLFLFRAGFLLNCAWFSMSPYFGSLSMLLLGYDGRTHGGRSDYIYVL